MQKDKYTSDLTEGKVWKQLLFFAIPFLFANILQAFYSVADMLVVGKFMGPVGISSVNLSSQIMMLLTSLVTGMSIGGTVLISQFVGAKDEKSAGKTIGTLFTFFLVIALVLTIFSLVFSGQLLQIINVPKTSFDEAQNYLRISGIGIVFIFGYNAVSAILRGLGDSKRPLYFIAVATILNVILDIIFVGFCGFGAGGAAAATVIAQATSFILAIYSLVKSDFVFDFNFKSFAIDKDIFWKLLKIGFPSSVQMTVTSMSFLFLSSFVNAYDVVDSSASAAFGIGGKIDGFAVLPAIAMSSAISAMVGQNIGANKMDRVRKTLLFGIMFAFILEVVVFFTSRIFSEQIIMLFTNKEEIEKSKMMIEYAMVYLRTATFSYLFFPFMFSFNGLANGTGNTVFSLLNALVSSVFVRVPLAYILSENMGFGLYGVFYAMPFATAIGGVTGFMFYLSGIWKKRKFVGKSSVQSLKK